MRSVLRLVVFVRGEEQAYLRIGSALFQGHGALRGGAPTEDLQGACNLGIDGRAKWPQRLRISSALIQGHRALREGTPTGNLQGTFNLGISGRAKWPPRAAPYPLIKRGLVLAGHGN